MSVISSRFADELTDKRMRDAYLSAQTRTRIAKQIRTIRAGREWSQTDFAQQLGKPQSTVSRLEDREYGKVTLQTLLDVASAFDVGLVVKFVPYESFLRDTASMAPSKLDVDAFERAALEPLTREGSSYQAATSASSPYIDASVESGQPSTYRFVFANADPFRTINAAG